MSAKEVIKLMEEHGWFEVRQNGSHKIFQHLTIKKSITVPFHGNKDLPKGTLNAILKQAGIKK